MNAAAGQRGPVALGGAAPGARVPARRPVHGRDARRARAGARGSSRRPSSRPRRSSCGSASRTSGPPTAGTSRRGRCSPGCRTSPRRRPRLRRATSPRSLAPRRRSSSRASSATPRATPSPRSMPGSTSSCRARRPSTRTRCPAWTTSAPARATTPRSTSAVAPRAPCSACRPRPRCAALPPDVSRVDCAVGWRRAARRRRERPAARVRAICRDALARAGRRRPRLVRAAADGRHDPDASTSAAQETAFGGLRHACEDRHGKPDSFPADLAALTGIARGFGESPEGAPWRADPHTGAPLEAARSTRPPPSRLVERTSCRATRPAARSASPTRAASAARRCRGAPSTTAT